MLDKSTNNTDYRNRFIVYVDESGDHSLLKIDDKYPVFVLAFCVFYQNNYIDNVVSSLEHLKFERFGHDIIIMHERDIRKETGIFKFKDKPDKNNFIEKLNTIINDSNFILISCIIDKNKLQIDVDANAAQNPYHIALRICLETLFELLIEKNQQEVETHIVFECRGKKEDKELELEFRRICSGANKFSKSLPFVIVFADKKVNSTGLQFADLVARPIGINHLRPEQDNRAFETLRSKFFCQGGRDKVGQNYHGWGLKIYPHPKSEKPR
jgi:hypothetical protein